MYNVLLQKVQVTTIVDTSVGIHDETAIKNWLLAHPQYCSRCQFIILASDENQGYDTLFIGATDKDYFTVFVFSWYMPFQRWRYTRGRGWD